MTFFRAALLAVAAAAFAAAAPAQEGVLGTAVTIDGKTITGRLTVTSAGRATITADAGATEIDVAELRSFERAGAVLAAVSAPHQVWLRSGQVLRAVRLSGRPGGDGKPSLLAVELPSGLRVDVPIGMVRALRHGGSERPEPALFAADFAAPPANEDLIYVQKDGRAQRSAVVVTGLQADRIDFTLRGTAYDFALVGTAAVVFGANTGLAPNRQPKPRTVVELTTGERLEGRMVELGAALRLRLDEGVVLDVPHASLLRFGVASDRLVWLADLTPRVDQTPAFDRSWPWTVDRSALGQGFVLGGKTFTRGIGLVPRTRLTYDLGGKFDLFEATIGIDDRGGPEAHAVFRVLADDQVVYTSSPMTLGKPPEVLRVELSKCQRLAIEVDFGKNYDLGDFCAFAEARVVQR